MGAAGSVPTIGAAAPVAGVSGLGAIGPSAPSMSGATNAFVIPGTATAPFYTGPGTLLSSTPGFFGTGPTAAVTGTGPFGSNGGPVYGAAVYGAYPTYSPVYIVLSGAQLAPASSQAAPAYAAVTSPGGKITNAPGMGQFTAAAPTVYGSSAGSAAMEYAEAQPAATADSRTAVVYAGPGSPDVVANAGPNGRTYTGGYNSTGEYQGGPHPTREFRTH